jgi:CheY-like chemotaxis protein
LTDSGSKIPVVFVTASDSEVTRKAAMDAGCMAYLEKPFPARALMNLLDRALTPP